MRYARLHTINWLQTLCKIVLVVPYRTLVLEYIVPAVLLRCTIILPVPTTVVLGIGLCLRYVSYACLSLVTRLYQSTSNSVFSLCTRTWIEPTVRYCPVLLWNVSRDSFGTSPGLKTKICKSRVYRLSPQRDPTVLPVVLRIPKGTTYRYLSTYCGDIGGDWERLRSWETGRQLCSTSVLRGPLIKGNFLK